MVHRQEVGGILASRAASRSSGNPSQAAESRAALSSRPPPAAENRIKRKYRKDSKDRKDRNVNREVNREDEQIKSREQRRVKSRFFTSFATKNAAQSFATFKGNVPPLARDFALKMQYCRAVQITSKITILLLKTAPSLRYFFSTEIGIRPRSRYRTEAISQSPCARVTRFI